MIEELQGDVFKSKEQVLIHGANCFNTMSSGIAKTVKELYPNAYEEDKKTIKGDKNKLGNFTFWSGKHYYYNQNIIVVNLYSQYTYGKGLQLDYDALEKGLKNIKFVFRGLSFAMPKIGAGLAGGDWNKIKPIIEKCFTEHKKNELVRIYSL